MSIRARDLPRDVLQAIKPKRSKYRNVKTTVDGVTFDSKREAAHYIKLRALAEAGRITDLVLQPKFPIIIHGIKVCEYRGDFAFTLDGKQVVQDCKGFRTKEYTLKKKLVKAWLGIEIEEV